MVAQRLLVVGGNGFLGSAVCKAAVARGWEVTSISKSGRPFTTPKGHSPAWTSKVSWHAASAHDPQSYASLLPSTTAVVHTLGLLFEDESYKTALKNGDIPGLIGAFSRSISGSSNPLKKESKSSYQYMNRDSALEVLRAYLSALPSSSNSSLRPFVYISAEDIFRPVVPSGYIDSKRDAERQIEEITTSEQTQRVRGVYLRPSLIYHAHLRPLTSPLAALLSLSSSIHSGAPKALPTPASLLRTLTSSQPSSALNSIANALEIPPIHVEHVAEAACNAIERDDVRGPLGVRAMRELIGWEEKGDDYKALNAHT